MSANQDPLKPHLIRAVGLGSGIALVVGGTVGSGIFKSPSGIAEQLPGPLPMLAVWIVGGFLVLCGALTAGELASAFPYSGGQYVYIREGFGRFAGFMFGWMQLILAGPASIGALALVFGQYALKLVSNTPSNWTVALFASIAITAVAVANVFGLKLGTAIQNVTTIAKIGGLLTLIVLALTLGLSNSGGHFTPAAPTGSFSVPMFGLALVSALWAYNGWMRATAIGGEFTNPQKNIPRSILVGTLLVICLYVLANVAYLSVFSVQEIGKSSAVAADTMAKLTGPVGVTFITATVMISTFGTMSASILTYPRVFFAMAEDGLFFSALAVVHPKYKTPHLSIIATSILATVFVIVSTLMSGSKAFLSLTSAFVIGNAPFYALAVASIFVFRRREVPSTSEVEPIEDSLEGTQKHRYSPAFHVPLYPVLPILFVVANLFLIANSLIDRTSQGPTAITLVIILVGAPLFFLSSARKISA
jgi:amino acid transporter